MSRHRVPYVAVALLGLVIAACSGSSATPSPTTAAPPSVASASPSASAAPSSSAAPSGSSLPSIALPSGSGAFPSFSLPHEDPALEAVLPSSINGAQLQKGSFKGAGFVQGAGNNAKQFTDFLGALGKSPNDVSFAIAVDMSGTFQGSVGAFRVAGADQGQLMTAFTAAAKQGASGAQVTQANVGGKDVTKIVDPTDTSGAQYVYGKGDTLFLAQAKDDATAATMLQALP
jgi:hypothetical protein